MFLIKSKNTEKINRTSSDLMDKINQNRHIYDLAKPKLYAIEFPCGLKLVFLLLRWLPCQGERPQSSHVFTHCCGGGEYMDSFIDANWNVNSLFHDLNSNHRFYFLNLIRVWGGIIFVCCFRAGVVQTTARCIVLCNLRKRKNKHWLLNRN